MVDPLLKEDGGLFSEGNIRFAQQHSSRGQGCPSTALQPDARLSIEHLFAI